MLDSLLHQPRSLSLPGGELSEKDPRIGSARDNSTGGTLSKFTSSSATVAGLATSLAPVLIYSAVCFLLFLWFRPRFLRTYAPRTFMRNLFLHERSTALPDGWIKWLKPLWQIPDAQVLNGSSLDAFLFLRFVKMLSFICFWGCALTWPVLFPLHTNGNGGNEGLDKLSIGNVTESRYFIVHAFVAWVYFGGILFTICRESIYYINLRHAYLLSPYYTGRLSSRTVLFTCVPKSFCDAARIRKMFGDGVKTIWIPQDTTVLENLVREREQTAQRLENAEIKLIQMANKARKKQNKQGTKTRSDISSAEEPKIGIPSLVSVQQIHSKSGPEPEPETDAAIPIPDIPDVNGSVAAQWVPTSQRPYHRPISNFCRRVDTIKWCRRRLQALTPQINKIRRKHRAGDGVSISTVFVEFVTQTEAQRAYRALAHHKPLHMSPRFIGLKPDEIVWSSIGIGWWQLVCRRLAVMALIVAAIVFWSIPSALVGMVSNISYLTETFRFLAFIEKIPSPILGPMSGLIPAMALTVMMALVPFFLRGCARLAGVPSLSKIELFVQNAYFAFQVIQVFLVTTLTSAASAAFESVLQEPLSAKDLLAQNLPKSSTFYISYILIQCLAASAGALLHLIGLFKNHVFAKITPTPRMRFRGWIYTQPVHWGTLFPIVTNLGVIAISYACIAPLILIFAAIGLYIVYFISKYNLVFVFNTTIDTRGLVYPRALKHLLVGLYLAEICLVGLFLLRLAIVATIMMVLFLIFTTLIHISLSDAINPFLHDLPTTLATENGADHQPGCPSTTPSSFGSNWESEYYTQPQYGNAFGTQYQHEDEEEEGMAVSDQAHHEVHGSRGPSEFRHGIPEGIPALLHAVWDWAKEFLKTRASSLIDSWGLAPHIAYMTYWMHPDATTTPNPNSVLHWLHPGVFDEAHLLRQRLMPADFQLKNPAADYRPDYAARVYCVPEMWTPAPRLWLPRDEAGVSAQEVRHSRGVIKATDEGAWLVRSGRVVIDEDAAPYWEDFDQALY